MTKEELATLRGRMAALFGDGDDHAEIGAIWMRHAAQLDFIRAMAAMEQYALHDGGKKRRFIAGRFLKYYEAQPEPRKVVLVDRTAKAREAQLVEAKRAERAHAIAEEREADRRLVMTANPLLVGEIVDRLVGWGAPRPPSHPEHWPSPWFIAVSDLLRGGTRAAPTANGYYEQTRDEHGQWVDDLNRPLNPVPVGEFWQRWGAFGLAARGLLAAGKPA
jgi:hypothetical protein